MLKKLHKTCVATLLGCLAMSTQLMADENDNQQLPQQKGIIRDVNLNQNWVTINTRRLTLTRHTQIRNLATGGSHSRYALQEGRPVKFTANREHELVSITIYPVDPVQRARLGDDSVETLQ